MSLLGEASFDGDSYCDDKLIMKGLIAYTLIGFVLIWLALMSSVIFNSVKYKSKIKPHTDSHAALVSDLFYRTCVLSKLNPEKLEQKAIDADMKKDPSKKKPRQTYGMERINQAWVFDTKLSLETGSNYQPFPNQLWLMDMKTRSYQQYSKTKKQCRLDFHHGVIRSKSRPYDISRRGQHARRYRRLMAASVLKNLEADSAKIINIDTLYKDPRVAFDPIIYQQDGHVYHMTVTPFSMTLELAN